MLPFYSIRFQKQKSIKKSLLLLISLEIVFDQKRKQNKHIMTIDFLLQKSYLSNLKQLNFIELKALMSL